MKDGNVEFKLDIQMDKSLITSKIESRIHRVQSRLDSQVLKDSNYYCPMQTGTLIKSGIDNTVLGSGVVQWNTPYAREQYYGHPNKSKDKNPNATMAWFETAKSKKMKEWEKLINDEYHKND